MNPSTTKALTHSPQRSLVFGVVRTVLGPIAARMRARRVENALYELDDRMLRDIGLTRSEIAYLAGQGRDRRA